MSAVPRSDDSPPGDPRPGGSRPGDSRTANRTWRQALSVWVSAPAAGPADGVECLRFEYTSRGDRVPGRLLLPTDGARPAPLILLQHGAGGSKDTGYMDAAAAPWAQRGAAVASIDFPLHGERHSDKLSAGLLRSFAARGAGAAAPWPELWSEFVAQSVADLRRALDALETLPGIDAGRCAYASFSMGSLLGAGFCAADPRPRAAALALGGGGFEPKALDPARSIGGFAPRPLLFVNASRDERIPRASAEALHAAAGEPKRVEWFDAGHDDLPGRALKSMWRFLAEQLGIG